MSEIVESVKVGGMPVYIGIWVDQPVCDMHTIPVQKRIVKDFSL